MLPPLLIIDLEFVKQRQWKCHWKETFFALSMIYLSQLAVKLIYEFVAFWGQMYFEKENMDCERSVNSITL